jgi:hypothetical protein
MTSRRKGDLALAERAHDTRTGAEPDPEVNTLHDADLSQETLLGLAPGVRTRFDVAGHVLLDAPDGTVVDLGPRGFAILSLFSQPLALGEAIERLERQGPSTDFAPTVNIINMLIEEGALVRPGAGEGPTSGWADPVEHARMLHDNRRTGDYLAALAEAVRPGDVVLDAYDLLANGFYERLGYQTVGVIEGCPAGALVPQGSVSTGAIGPFHSQLCTGWPPTWRPSLDPNHSEDSNAPRRGLMSSGAGQLSSGGWRSGPWRRCRHRGAVPGGRRSRGCPNAGQAGRCPVRVPGFRRGDVRPAGRADV